MSKRKEYGPSLREQIRSRSISIQDAAFKAPFASEDTKRKWQKVAYRHLSCALAERMQ